MCCSWSFAGRGACRQPALSHCSGSLYTMQQLYRDQGCEVYRQQAFTVNSSPGAEPAPFSGVHSFCVAKSTLTMHSLRRRACAQLRGVRGVHLPGAVPGVCGRPGQRGGEDERLRDEPLLAVLHLLHAAAAGQRRASCACASAARCSSSSSSLCWPVITVVLFTQGKYTEGYWGANNGCVALPCTSCFLPKRMAALSFMKRSAS